MKRRDLLIIITLGWGVAFLLSAWHSASARELTPIQLPADFQYPNGIARASNGTLVEE